MRVCYTCPSVEMPITLRCILKATLRANVASIQISRLRLEMAYAAAILLFALQVVCSDTSQRPDSSGEYCFDVPASNVFYSTRESSGIASRLSSRTSHRSNSLSHLAG